MFTKMFFQSPVDDLPLDVMCLSLTSMNIKSVHDGSENQILEKVDMEVDLTRVLKVQHKIPQQKVHLNSFTKNNFLCQVCVRFTTVEFLLSEAEYKFLWGMMNSITAQLAAAAQAASPALPATPAPAPTEVTTAEGLAYSVCKILNFSPWLTTK